MIIRCANELRNTYEVYANFYEREVDGLGTVLCRNVADIINKETSLDSSVDAYIVMLNPGSCMPLESYEYAKSSSFEYLNMKKCKDDPAQQKVMNLMDNQNWKHVRIINLSDIINPKSEKFIDIYSRAKEDSHSIFSVNRKEELEGLIKEDSICILSWGKCYELKELAIRAKKALEDKTIIGIPFDEEKIFYRYIKPRNYNHQKQVIQELSELCSKITDERIAECGEMEKDNTQKVYDLIMSWRRLKNCVREGIYKEEEMKNIALRTYEIFSCYAGDEIVREEVPLYILELGIEVQTVADIIVPIEDEKIDTFAYKASGSLEDSDKEEINEKLKAFTYVAKGLVYFLTGCGGNDGNYELDFDVYDGYVYFDMKEYDLNVIVDAIYEYKPEEEV